MGDAAALERRLALAYLSAFAIVLALFALAVHVAFALDGAHDVESRIADLVAEGSAAVKERDGRLRVDIDGARLGDPTIEGLAWYDARGHLADSEGATVSRTRDVRRRTVTFPLGSLVATTDISHDRHELERIDVLLGIGLLVALVAAGFGGKFLAARAIARVVATMRTLRDFTADAAHELRGPLAAVTSNAAASLRDDADLAENHRRRFDVIDATARSMARTVDDLLLIARAGTPLERETFAVDLDERVALAVESRRTLAAQKDVALRAEACGRARAYGDPNEIDRILGNLIDNALRFTPAGGRVDITCAHERGGIALRVRDTGIGIPASDLERIFERFWRGDAVRTHDTGTGLGLPIVRALVRRHGGSVQARSTVREGSEFVVWLPGRPPQPRLYDFTTIR